MQYMRKHVCVPVRQQNETCAHTHANTIYMHYIHFIKILFYTFPYTLVLH